MKFNLSLDDFSPHPKAGLNFESINWCERLIKRYPAIKINLFVPAAYCRLGEKPCYLSEHPEWVERAKGLSNNYEINLHGLYHRRIDEKHPDSNNDEFQFLRGEWVKVITNRMIEEFNKAGLKFSKVFRPPGWKISLAAARELSDQGFVIAGSKEYYDLLKDKVDGLKWVSYNWDLTGPCTTQGDVIAYGHTSSFTNNYLDETRYNLIVDFLDKQKVDFKFIGELL